MRIEELSAVVSSSIMCIVVATAAALVGESVPNLSLFQG